MTEASVRSGILVFCLVVAIDRGPLFTALGAALILALIGLAIHRWFD